MKSEPTFASTSWLLFCVTFAVIISLAGCGGTPMVTPPSGGNPGPTTVTYTFDTQHNRALPIAVAVRIGTGSYSIQTLASGKLTLSIPNGQTQFSVAYLCPATGPTSLALNVEFIYGATLSDGTSFSKSCNASRTVSTGLATAQVDLSAIPGATYIQFGAETIPASSSVVNISGQLAVGTYDVPLIIQDSNQNPLAVKVLRGQTIPGVLNSSAPVVFKASDEIVPQAATYNSVPDGFSVARPLVLYETPGGASASLYSLNSPTSPLFKLPAASLQSGDFYIIVAQAYKSANLSSKLGNLSSVEVQKDSTSSGPESFTFPAPWSYSGPAPAKLPTFDFVYSGFAGMSDVHFAADLSWSTVPNTFNQILLTATASYLDQSTSLAVPDLSALPGFLAPAASGTTISWSARISQGQASTTNPQTGTFQSVLNTGDYGQP